MIRAGSYVLVVEDDCDIREMVALILSTAGVEIAAAGDGVEALEVLHATRRPDLILLDLMMPRMSGADLLRRIRAEPALATIPVVILSGAADAEQTARSFGCACLVKPVDIDDLLEVTTRLIPTGGRVGDAAPEP